MLPSASVSGMVPGGGVKPRSEGGELARKDSTAVTEV